MPKSFIGKCSINIELNSTYKENDEQDLSQQNPVFSYFFHLKYILNLMLI